MILELKNQEDISAENEHKDTVAIRAFEEEY